MLSDIGYKYLEIKNISKTYVIKNKPSVSIEDISTLEKISLEASFGEFVSIIGPSGCGKTTLFNLISGLEKPDSGRILLNGQEVTGQKGHTAYMLQKDMLLPWRTVLSNCMLALEVNRIPATKARKLALGMLEELELEKFAMSYPQELSGGMRQRVAFARTILAEKELLLLDEPFGALDAYTKSEMHRWFIKRFTKYKFTILFITHDIEEAILLSDRIYVFSPRPAAVRSELKVDIKRPRDRSVLTDERFIFYKKKLLEEMFGDK